MPVFRYDATDHTGVKLSATITAVDAKSATALLHAHGYTVHRIAAEAPAAMPPSPVQGSPPSAAAPGQCHWVRPQAVLQAEQAVTCGWCSVAFAERPESGHCPNCGAVLPMWPGRDRGPAPQAGPRSLPSGFSSQLFVRRNEEGMLGLIALLIAALIGVFADGSTGAMIAALVFACLGAFMTVHGFWRAARRRRVLRVGQPGPGYILEVAINEKGTTVGDDVAYRVRYQFSVGGIAHRGELCTTNSQVRAHQLGDPVWVVYLPSAIACNALWPPVA